MFRNLLFHNFLIVNYRHDCSVRTCASTVHLSICVFRIHLFCLVPGLAYRYRRTFSMPIKRRFYLVENAGAIDIFNYWDRDHFTKVMPTEDPMVCAGL